MLVSPRQGSIRSGMKLAVAALAVIALAPFASRVSHLLGALPNPFTTERHERVQPPVLQSLQDLSEYHAATANLQAVVELSHDAEYVPSFIVGDDATFLATGSVDAVVDFSELTGDAIRTSEDGKTVTVTLPAPRYDQADLDLENSQVLSRSRGLLNRVGGVFGSDPTPDQALYKLGETALTDAAADTELLERARTNTTATLTALIQELGYENVTVVFDEPPRP
ncbi:hypothetical protein BH18ACT4_BH18ACT4_07940 [soil metagenome]